MWAEWFDTVVVVVCVAWAATLIVDSIWDRWR